MKLKAIIVDDEINAATSLEILLSDHSDVIEIVGTAHNALEAIKLINKTKPEVVFLDVNMPYHSGFDVLEHFELNEFSVVFTTAHEEHAIKAIKVKAFDYLLKPIDEDELSKCISNLKEDFSKREKEALTLKASLSNNVLSIPIREGAVFVKQDEILRIEGDGSYSTFHTIDKKQYTVSKNLKEYEDLLTNTDFFRAHKSHIINIKKVKKYLKTDGYFAEMTDGTVVEIARRKKDEFLWLMNEQA